MTKENPSGSMGEIIKYAVLAAVAYYGYQYLVSSGMWAQWFGGTPLPQLPAAGGTVVQPGQNVVPITVPVNTSALQNQLAAAGAAFTANTGQSPNVDQWVYYYQQAKGVTLSGPQVESLIQTLGLNDASRATTITLAQFMGALGHVGLGSIINVPNAGPIAAPLPTQSFGGGFGGYSRGGRTNRWVQ